MFPQMRFFLLALADAGPHQRSVGQSLIWGFLLFARDSPSNHYQAKLLSWQSRSWADRRVPATQAPDPGSSAQDTLWLPPVRPAVTASASPAKASSGLPASLRKDSPSSQAFFSLLFSSFVPTRPSFLLPPLHSFSSPLSLSCSSGLSLSVRYNSAPTSPRKHLLPLEHILDFSFPHCDQSWWRLGS